MIWTEYYYVFDIIEYILIKIFDKSRTLHVYLAFKVIGEKIEYNVKHSENDNIERFQLKTANGGSEDRSNFWTLSRVVGEFRARACVCGRDPRTVGIYIPIQGRGDVFISSV